MKVSYNLLKSFVSFDLEPMEFAWALTSIGIETSVISNTCNWPNVVTAKILDINKHPQADKLSLCKVSDGTKEYTIVCGAKNISVGQVVPLAKVGAVLPNNFQIKKSKIRGIESEGMLCSKKELGISKESEGIYILDDKTKIGSTLESVLGDSDSIFDIEITPNRGDVLSHLGVAREIGAKLKKIVTIPKIKTFNVSGLNCVQVKSNLCLRYIGGVISDIKVGESPKWVKDILEKSGIRSINNIVDITNYVMLELGQPLHAFDLEKLSSKNIVVRAANESEKITALDGKEYSLSSDMLVIADDKQPVAIAGVMGGQYSGIDVSTQTVFLESAIFDSVSIRKTSRKLNLSSDSSYRFERGLSWDIAETAFWRAVNLISDIAGGKIEAREDLQNVKREKTSIALRINRVFKVLGYKINEDEIIEILRYLGIDLESKGEVIFCTVPSWRNDIKEEVDLVEEIVRIKGYDTIPLQSKQAAYSSTLNESFIGNTVENFRVKLNGLGFNEALNCSFCEIKELEKFGLQYSYKIMNPVSKENEVLRPSLLPGLYKNLMLNISQCAESVTLFEFGKVFNELGEKKNFSLIAYGRVWQEWWKWEEQKISPKYDFYFGGGVIKNILSEDFVIVQNLTPAKYYHIGKTASIIYRGQVIGQVGILSPSINEDLKDEIFYCQMDIDAIEKDKNSKVIRYKSFSKLPLVRRDISVIADKSLPFNEIESIIKGVMKSNGILRNYSLFSVYTDEAKIGKGKISYSLRLLYRDDNKTLTDAEVNKDMIHLLEKLDKNLQVKLRD
ncbi:MAG: phenylalanine--tRNA ligase subunit beta [Endomicrobium sp.]|jgi:phenylalanyl-tRNA synthetase beta chain|nr:phenylalanine--tRNA ligase subunit beta [Endomicrobium sp.]